MAGIALPSLGYLLFKNSFFGDKKPNITGSIVGASHQTGHLLRDKAIMGQNPERTEKKIVIVGGGIAGLSALRALVKAGETDIILLEHEPEAGGNSSYRQNSTSKYPLGAHYIPIPDLSFQELKDFLEEHRIIVGYNAQGLPIFEEEFLCFEPDERLFIHGHWQEGIIPHFGVPEAEQEEIKRFLTQMDQFRQAIGDDGLPAFRIPVDTSSTDPAFALYDQMTMGDFLKKEGFSSNYLTWYVDYCCRDDYGTSLADTSAWAGIHYFAARRGKAANAASDDVLTWPEGNGRLMDLLKQGNEAFVKTNSLVYNVALAEGKATVSYLDVATQKTHVVSAQKVIMATPQFINQYLLSEKRGFDAKQFTYSPWMVANITLKTEKDGSGAPLSWDNVYFGDSSLGYVNACHQRLQVHQHDIVITFYKPLADLPPAEARTYMLSRTHADWADDILKTLKKGHKTFAERVQHIEIWLWGHGIVRPVKGFVTSEGRKQAQQPIGNTIFFAHSDLSGISIFEEAFYQGNRAAKEVMKVG